MWCGAGGWAPVGCAVWRISVWPLPSVAVDIDQSAEDSNLCALLILSLHSFSFNGVSGILRVVQYREISLSPYDAFACPVALWVNLLYWLCPWMHMVEQEAGSHPLVKGLMEVFNIGKAAECFVRTQENRTLFALTKGINLVQTHTQHYKQNAFQHLSTINTKKPIKQTAIHCTQ